VGRTLERVLIFSKLEGLNIEAFSSGRSSLTQTLLKFDLSGALHWKEARVKQFNLAETF